MQPSKELRCELWRERISQEGDEAAKIDLTLINDGRHQPSGTNARNADCVHNPGDIGGQAMSKHSPDLPGWLGTARRNGSAEAPGRPGRAGKGQPDPNGPREYIAEDRLWPGVGEAHTSEEAG
jgi:hypothetical protein